MKTSSICFLLLFIGCYMSQAQHRISQSINSNWNFCLGNNQPDNSNSWEKVSLPHSWNTTDVTDDIPGYYRGVGWYKRTLFIPSAWQDKDIYIHFEGAAQVAEVFVNGKSVGTHTGSYTAFSFPIHSHLRFSEEGNSPNEIIVKVDNSHSEDIAPLSGDFTFFGGLYRDVYLKVLDQVHFDMDNMASNGLFITTPAVSAEKATVKVDGAFVNRFPVRKKVTVVHQIINRSGVTVATEQQTFEVSAGQKITFNHTFPTLNKPTLWSTENPYLYHIVSTIKDTDRGTVWDEVSNPLGFRWYHFDAEKGFFLNGKPLKLIGASRHQDFKGMANALPDAMHVRDVELLKEMGGNFLRIAHYPQHPIVLETCDRLGILTSVETPIVNRITASEAFADNAKKMHLEMIRQNFNHPSLIIWAYMNEVLLRPRYEKGSAQQEDYFNSITQLAQELEDLTRAEDPYRYTLIPNHGSFDLYNRVQLTKIPMLVGWNLYQGWYGSDLNGFARYLDRHRSELPDKPLLITEYGADADIRLHSTQPIRFDKTVEYATIYHQAYLQAMLDRPFVAGGMIWNLADFSSEQRGETTPHINAKGILTWDRQAKDGYLFYQSNLVKDRPILQFGSKEWTLRTGFTLSEEEEVCIQPVQIFSNLDNVGLLLNGKPLGTTETRQGIATFNVPFINGFNSLVAFGETAGQRIFDRTDIQFQLLSPNLKQQKFPFEQLNISLGDKRTFFDEKRHEVWLPEQAYYPGSWGYIGGEVFKMTKTERQQYGSDKNILGTDLDPIYATQRTGLKQFKFDVPDGNYEVTLHFAELISNIQREELAYNLGSKEQEMEQFTSRIFHVDINGKNMLHAFSNLEDLIPETAVSEKFNILVTEGKGITIDFRPVQGASILNGIQLRKNR